MNEALDIEFYDVDSLSPEDLERVRNANQDITPSLDHLEGRLVSIPAQKEEPLKVWPSLATFLSEDHTDYKAIAVAGVGSTLRGGAAFGRNVAAGLEAPVLVIVAGNGLIDLLFEAMGGYVLFGHLNIYRHLHSDWPALRQAQEPILKFWSTYSLVRNSPDVRTLIALLQTDRAFPYLVGHSKGNLVISEALYALGEEAPEILQARGRTTDVITLSAMVAMPKEMRSVIDVMGDKDYFLGMPNSRWSLKPDVPVKDKGHSTNKSKKNALDVEEILRDLMAANIGSD